MRLLAVGDVHCVVSEMEECSKLMQYVADTAVSENVDEIVLTGDYFHNHGLVNTEVAYFWEGWFDTLSNLVNNVTLNRMGVNYLLGNHDYPPQNKQAHALRRFDSLPFECFNVVEGRMVDRRRSILYVGHHAKNEDFVNICKEYSFCNIVFCHASFNTAQYDNGMYISDGIDLNDIPQKYVISGHLHKPQQIGKLHLVGSPRWRSVSDANTDRAIWLFEIKDGEIINRIPFSTNHICSPIYCLVDSPIYPVNISDLSKNSRFTFDIHGPVDYVKRRVLELAPYGRVRQFPDRPQQINVKESDGIPVAFSKFLKLYKSPNGTSSKELFELSKERISWMR